MEGVKREIHDTEIVLVVGTEKQFENRAQRIKNMKIYFNNGIESTVLNGELSRKYFFQNMRGGKDITLEYRAER